VLLTSLAYLVLAANAGASDRAATGKADALAPQEAHARQYHGTQGQQYHGIDARVGRTLAWQHARNGSAAELAMTITASLISRNSISHSTIAGAKREELLFSRPDVRFADRNDRPISPQIGAGTERQSRDLRLMLQIGVVLGLVYLAFLAVWFWATRFRMRPPSSART
jgi:hypothetical protein